MDVCDRELARISPKRLRHFVYFSSKKYPLKLIKLLFNVLIIFTSKRDEFKINTDLLNKKFKVL